MQTISDFLQTKKLFAAKTCIYRANRTVSSFAKPYFLSVTLLLAFFSTTLFAQCLVDDRDVRPIPSGPKPAYLEPYTDPDFGTTVIRITGDEGDAIPNISGDWGDVTRHHYFKDPAWNADQTLLMLDRNGSGPGPLFLDGNTYEPLFSRSCPGSEDRWHPVDPDLRIYMGSNIIGTWNVMTDEDTVLHTFSGYSDFRFGPGEGFVSNDGRYVAVNARNGSAHVGFAYDIKNNVKFPSIHMQVEPVFLNASPFD